MELFEQKNITVFSWPSNSSDLNPIEHVWVYMKQKLDHYPELPKT
jgi:transposase